MTELRKETKEIHFDGKCYYFELKSELLPFVTDKRGFTQLEKANEIMQKFVRYIEKKFDAVWYIGTDYLGDELYERFMFHHGGFMEISMNGELRVYLVEDKIDKLKSAIIYAAENLSSKASGMYIVKSAKTGERLIRLEDSVKLIGDKK